MFGAQQNEQAKAYGRIVAKAWSDPQFKQRFLADPKAVLESEGIPVPEGKDLHVVENSDSAVYLTLPARPTELADEQLDSVAGGSSWKWDSALCW